MYLLSTTYSLLLMCKSVFKRIFIFDRIKYRILFALGKASKKRSDFYHFGVWLIKRYHQFWSLSVCLSVYVHQSIYRVHVWSYSDHHYHWKLNKSLMGDLYLSVIHHCICQIKPYSFPLRKNKVNYGHSWPPVSIWVNKLYKCLIGDFYSSLMDHTNHQPKPYSLPLWKNRVN